MKVIFPGRFSYLRGSLLTLSVAASLVGAFLLVQDAVLEIFKEKMMIVTGVYAVMITFFLAALARTDVSKDLDGFDASRRALIREALARKKKSYLRGVVFYICCAAFLFVGVLALSVFDGAKYFVAIFVPFSGAATMFLLLVLYDDYLDVESLRDKIYERQQVEKKREKLISELTEAKEKNPLKPDEKLAKYRGGT